MASLSGDEDLSMERGAVARNDVSGRVADRRAVLRWLVPPDLLDPDRG
jgi:hypothetical protein